MKFNDFTNPDSLLLINLTPLSTRVPNFQKNIGFCQRVRSVFIKENMGKMANIASELDLSGYKSAEEIVFDPKIERIENATVTIADAENIKEIDVSKLHNCSGINACFIRCKSLKTIIFPEDFMSPDNTILHSFLKGCESLESIDLSMFDTGNVNYFTDLFSGCINLKELNISNWNFKRLHEGKNIITDLMSLEKLIMRNIKDTDKLESYSFAFYKNIPGEIDMTGCELKFVLYIAKTINKCFGPGNAYMSNPYLMANLKAKKFKITYTSKGNDITVELDASTINDFIGSLLDQMGIPNSHWSLE